jgi:hypothetical protein
MLRKLASVIFLLDSVEIGLGAFGHAFQVRHLHSATDRFPIESDVHSMIYVVWYFLSGCMFVFGATLIWVWQRLRTGDRGPLFVAVSISVLYAGIGVFGLVYRHGDPFMATFVVTGSLLLISGYILAAGASPSC